MLGTSLRQLDSRCGQVLSECLQHVAWFCVFSRALLLARSDSTSHSVMSSGGLSVCLSVRGNPPPHTVTSWSRRPMYNCGSVHCTFREPGWPPGRYYLYTCTSQEKLNIFFPFQTSAMTAGTKRTARCPAGAADAVSVQRASSAASATERVSVVVSSS